MPWVLAYMVAYFFQGGTGGGAVGLITNLRSYLWIPISQNSYRRVACCGLCVWVVGWWWWWRGGAHHQPALIPLDPHQPEQLQVRGMLWIVCVGGVVVAAL